MAGSLKFYPTCRHFQPSYKMTALHHPWVQWPQGRISLSFLPGPLVMTTWPWSPLPQVFSTNPCAGATLLGPHSLSSFWPKTISGRNLRYKTKLPGIGPSRLPPKPAKQPEANHWGGARGETQPTMHLLPPYEDPRCKCQMDVSTWGGRYLVRPGPSFLPSQITHLQFWITSLLCPRPLVR